MRSMARRLLNGVRRCGNCNKRILMQGYNINKHIGELMDKCCICYECAFWQELIDYPHADMEVVGNQCLKVGGVENKWNKVLILGGKGVMRYFMRLDFSTFRSNDVWLIGTIPERFRKQIPPTAIEITSKAYNQLNRNNKRCLARGCMDRYNCVRFDLSLEDKKGAANTVPDSWKVGDEHCGFRIGFENIINDERNILPKHNSQTNEQIDE